MGTLSIYLYAVQVSLDRFFLACASIWYHLQTLPQNDQVTTIFVSALILVVTAMAAYIKSSKDAEIQTGELNAAVEAATEGHNLCYNIGNKNKKRLPPIRDSQSTG